MMEVLPVTEKMTAEKRKTIYGMATQLGIYDKSNKDDDLHAIVHRLTGKESIGQLTDKEASLVIRELVKLKGGRTASTHQAKSGKKKESPQHRPGMINPKQQKAVWWYMYRLEELDEVTSSIPRADRLCAIIKKHLSVDAVARDPFRFVSFENGITLIEVLKKILRYEERRAKKKAEVLGNRNG